MRAREAGESGTAAVIRIVRGNPTAEELAAAVAVVQARAAAAAYARGTGGTEPGAWSDPARLARRGVPAPGPRAWARSYWPS